MFYSKKLKELRERLVNIEAKIDAIPELRQRLINIESKIDFLNNLIIKNNKDRDYIHEAVIDGYSFYFQDAITSFTVPAVIREIGNAEYNFENIPFSPGDCVIDIGANVGIISIYLAKKYPFLKIYSYEPVKRNYLNLMKNLELNSIPEGTIIAENKAVTKDNRKIKMNFDICNSGGSFSEEAITYRNNAYYTTSLIDSITLDDIFKKYSINKLKLLKIDCEGSEYEILYNTKNLSKISFIRGEFHCPAESEEASRLLEYCKKFVSNVFVQINNS